VCHERFKMLVTDASPFLSQVLAICAPIAWRIGLRPRWAPMLIPWKAQLWPHCRETSVFCGLVFDVLVKFDRIGNDGNGCDLGIQNYWRGCKSDWMNYLLVSYTGVLLHVMYDVGFRKKGTSDWAGVAKDPRKVPSSSLVTKHDQHMC
jgi:hypothetical protein